MGKVFFEDLTKNIVPHFVTLFGFFTDQCEKTKEKINAKTKTEDTIFMYFKRKKLILFLVHIFFRFYGSSGLLKSKIDESGSYLYEYDIYGRLVKAILPTGQAIGLQFNLTSQGAAIDVMKNGIMSEVVLVQDQLVSTFFSLFSIW